jgi:hypothetical protein
MEAPKAQSYSSRPRLTSTPLAPVRKPAVSVGIDFTDVLKSRDVCGVPKRGVCYAASRVRREKRAQREP